MNKDSLKIGTELHRLIEENIKLKAALKPYADPDNWRSHHQSGSFQTWFDPAHLPIPNRNFTGMAIGGWELAQEALR